MRIIESSYQVEQCPDNKQCLSFLETCARTCYKSEGKIAPGSAEKLVRSVLERGHESVIEHMVITVRFIVDRGVSHELVRHRLASFSQESTRYVRYDGDGNEGHELTFIRPCFWDKWAWGTERNVKSQKVWEHAMQLAEEHYLVLLEGGAKPEEARSVLPNSLKTEIVVTANLREWRHILKLRTSAKAHSQMRQVMVPLGYELGDRLPVLFGGNL